MPLLNFKKIIEHTDFCSFVATVAVAVLQIFIAFPFEASAQSTTRPTNPDSLHKWCLERIDSAYCYNGSWDNYRGAIASLDALPLDLQHPEFPILPEAESTLREALYTDVGRLTGHDDIPLSVQFSPDGKILVSASKDNTIRLWDPLSGRLLKTLIGHGKAVNAAAFSPYGKKIASASSDYTVRQWDVATGQIINTPSLGLYQPTPFYSVQYSKNGKYLLAAGLDFTVVWNASTLEALHVFPAYIKENCDASFSPDAEKVVTIVDDSVRVWTLKEKPKYVSFGCDNSYVTFADFSPDGKYLAFTTYKGGFMLLDAKTGKTVFSDKEHYTYIFNASFTPDGKEIVFTCCNNIGCGAIISFDIESKVFSDLTGTTTANLAIAISPDGKRLALPLVDRTIRVETFTSSNTSTVRTGNPNAFKNGKGCKTTAVSPDGKFRATIMNNNKIQMTHTASGNIVEGFATRKDLDSERFISFSPDGRYIICGSKYQSDIEVLDAATGKDIKEFYAGGADVECAIFSPDGRKIIAKLKDGKILEYDFPPLQELIDYAIKRFNYSR